MTDNLRDRIAVIQAEHHHWDYGGTLTCACGQEFRNYPNDGWEARVQQWAGHVADAVIAELGLDEVLQDCRCRLRYLLNE